MTQFPQEVDWLTQLACMAGSHVGTVPFGPRFPCFCCFFWFLLARLPRSPPPTE